MAYFGSDSALTRIRSDRTIPCPTFQLSENEEVSMTRQALLPKAARLRSQIARAKHLASISEPMVAELYEMHLEICEERYALKSRKKGVPDDRPV